MADVASLVAGGGDDVRHVHLFRRFHALAEGLQERRTGIFPHHAVAPRGFLHVFLLHGLNDDGRGDDARFVKGRFRAVEIESEPAELLNAREAVLLAEPDFFVPVSSPPAAGCRKLHIE